MVYVTVFKMYWKVYHNPRLMCNFFVLVNYVMFFPQDDKITVHE